MVKVTDKLVSIIIPSYNHKKYIEELLKSIRAQTYLNIEIIVLDDGSTDGSPEFLKSIQPKYDFQLILKQNEGLCATLNRGLDLIKGEFVVIIASDDFMPEKRIEEQVAAFESNNLEVVAGGMTLIDEDSKIQKYVSPIKQGYIIFTDMLDKNVIYAPTAMFKSATFKKYGRYNPEHVIEDYSMWLNILSKGGCIANFDKNWAYYRTNQIVTRSKVDWYYKGLVQVLNDYKNRPNVQKALIRNKFIYLIKVTVFDGRDGLKSVTDISLFQLIILYSIAILPFFIRDFLKKRINRA